MRRTCFLQLDRNSQACDSGGGRGSWLQVCSRRESCTRGIRRLDRHSARYPALPLKRLQSHWLRRGTNGDLTLNLARPIHNFRGAGTQSWRRPMRYSHRSCVHQLNGRRSLGSNYSHWCRRRCRLLLDLGNLGCSVSRRCCRPGMGDRLLGLKCRRRICGPAAHNELVATQEFWSVVKELKKSNYKRRKNKLTKE